MPDKDDPKDRYAKLIEAAELALAALRTTYSIVEWPGYGKAEDETAAIEALEAALKEVKNG